VNTMMKKIVGFAYQGKKDIVVFRFIIEYSSLKGFWLLIIIIIGLFFM
jgi:hypothetical protein